MGCPEGERENCSPPRCLLRKALGRTTAFVEIHDSREIDSHMSLAPRAVFMPNVALHSFPLSDAEEVHGTCGRATLPVRDIASVQGRLSVISTNMGNENPCPGDGSPRGRRDVGMQVGLPTN